MRLHHNNIVVKRALHFVVISETSRESLRRKAKSVKLKEKIIFL